MRRTLPLASLLALCACGTTPPIDVAENLVLSADNQPELEMALGHFRRSQEKHKVAAAQFLIANMAPHGAVRIELTDANGEPLGFDARRFPNLAAAQAELDRLEEEFPGAEFNRTRFDRDLDLITSEYLIENIQLAFEARSSRPWAQGLSEEVFHHFVLPYRGSNEPLSSWRRDCMNQWADLPRRMEDPSDASEAARIIREELNEWIRFSDLYYLHPTDQSYPEMRRSGVGRCEDISNLAMFALRANAIPVTTDYTPWWADRDNNHAWEVVLDESGNGSAALSNRAAKVYRKTFAVQSDCLAARAPKGSVLPRWLDRRNFIDVTDQYVETSDVELRVDNTIGQVAYLCVFNGGEWRAITGSLPLADGSVKFPAMGRDVCYLPAWYLNDELVPAGPPFVLKADGTRLPLQAGSELVEVTVGATAPDTPDMDTRSTKAAIPVEPGAEYELFSWEDGWKSRGTCTLGEGSALGFLVPENALLWLVRSDSRRLERIFSVAGGAPRWW